MTCYVYILQSVSSEKYYVGVSENPERRLSYHNTIEKGFTSRYRPWVIKFTNEYPTKIEAMKIEKKSNHGKVGL